MELAAVVKKTPGTLLIDAEKAHWRSRSGEVAVIRLADVDDGSGMKATPPTAAKYKIKLSAGTTGLTIEFTELAVFEKARNELQTAIKAAKTKLDAPEQTPTDTTASAPTALAASDSNRKGASRSRTRDTTPIDATQALADLELQRRVLKEDRELARVFQQTVIAGELSNEQFWTPRVNLLLTTAQQHAQRRGAYNVLSTIRPVTGADNRVNISLTRERISDMFDQYPIVRKAYNDCVPRQLSEAAFWQKFFMSRLYLTLRGEKITQNHPPDPHLDRYITILDEQRKRRHAAVPAEVPGALDVEGNVQNNPETYGNGPDLSMRLASGGTAGLIHSMNGLSRRLLLGRQKGSTIDSKEALDVTSAIQLEDLEGPRKDDAAVPLKVTSLTEYGPRTTIEISASKRSQIAAGLDDLDLTEVGSDTDAVNDAQARIDVLLDVQARASGILDGVAVAEDVHIVHATTLEFLRQFWRARTDAYSPLKKSAKVTTTDLTSLRESLERSLERIAAIEPEVGPESKLALLSLRRQVDVALTT